MVVSGSDGHVWIGTDHGLYRLNTTPPTPVANKRHFIANTNDGIFAGDDIINNATVDQFVLMNEIEGPILSLAWRGGLVGPKGWGLQGNAFLFTNFSHFYNQNVSFSNGADWYNGSTHSTDDFGLLVIGTPSKLYFYDGHMIWFEWVSDWNKGIGGVVDGAPVTLTFVPTGELFIGNNVSLSRLNNDYTFDRFGGLQGLPYNRILSLRYSPFVPTNSSPKRRSSVSGTGTLWIGTEKGWSLFDIGNSNFIGYFYGPRWHSGNSIIDISGVNGYNMTILLTDKGLTIITAEEWTLEKKALYYQKILTRHVREPGE